MVHYIKEAEWKYASVDPCVKVMSFFWYIRIYMCLSFNLACPWPSNPFNLPIYADLNNIAPSYHIIYHFSLNTMVDTTEWIFYLLLQIYLNFSWLFCSLIFSASHRTKMSGFVYTFINKWYISYLRHYNKKN